MHERVFYRASSSAFVAALSGTFAGSVSAQAAPTVGAKAIIVAATYRQDKLNTISIAIGALSGKMLEPLNVNNFKKLVEYLPGVRTASRGPGVSSVYVRGLSTDAAGSQSLGVSGQQPHVALYANDAPASSPRRYATGWDRSMQPPRQRR